MKLIVHFDTETRRAAMISFSCFRWLSIELLYAKNMSDFDERRRVMTLIYVTGYGREQTLKGSVEWLVSNFAGYRRPNSWYFKF